MLRVKEVFISLIVIVLVSIHSRIFVVQTKHKQFLVKIKHQDFGIREESSNPNYSHVNKRRGGSGNDYLDYVDYTDYNNGVQGGDYLDELYVDENWHPNQVPRLSMEYWKLCESFLLQGI